MTARAFFTPAAALLCWLLLGILLPSPAAAAQVTTCDVPGSFATIQAAIDEPSCATIRLGKGTFFENITIWRAAAITGRGQRDTILDGRGAGSVITVARSGTAFLEGLTVTGGQAANGAGIYNNGTVVLTNSAVTANTATRSGGGIYNSAAAAARLRRSVISGNSATFGGGGLWNAGALAAAASEISGNVALNGGGLFNTAGGQAALQNTSLYENEALRALGLGGLGGAIYVDAGLVTVRGGSISYNSALTGAALYIAGAGEAHLRACTFITNLGWSAGGAIGNAGRLAAQDSIFRHNRVISGLGRSTMPDRGIYMLASGLLVDSTARRQYGWARWSVAASAGSEPLLHHEPPFAASH